MKALKIVIPIVIVLLLIVWWVIGFYNGMVVLNEDVDNQWAQVETQYQRRFDLIPNLVESVKGVMNQEQEVFLGIAEARKNYLAAQTTSDKVASINSLEQNLGTMIGIMVERYPTLNSSKNVQDLMTQLEGAENRISVERKRFNDKTKVYNVKVKRFPNMILAGIMGFDEKDFFESVEGSEDAPTVDLNLN